MTLIFAFSSISNSLKTAMMCRQHVRRRLGKRSTPRTWTRGTR